MIRNLCFGVTGAVAIASAANAADMYRAPEGGGGYKDGPAYVAPWAGFYAGVNGGYGWSESSNQLACPANCLAGFFGDSFSGLHPEGGFGGGQIGYNWQGIWHPHLVFGIEADIQGAGISAHALDGNGSTENSKLDWFGTVRTRLGYAFDRTLVYATGGFAYGGVENDVLFHARIPTDYRISRTATGYVAGGGIEYKFNPAWSVKAEYQYINLGTNDPFAPIVPGTFSSQGGTIKEDAYNTVRFGLNYHFAPEIEPLK
jgi:outer membrane immunogenic protein